MTHTLVEQLRFARNNFAKGLENMPVASAAVCVGQANCISWIVGHLAQFEQLSHCEAAQGITVSEAVKQCAFGEPASIPPFETMLSAWQAITTQADVWLDTLTEDDLKERVTLPDGRPFWENIGTMLQRHIWHYWYHIGEIQGIRQALGHEALPQFVGRIDNPARYTPNTAKQLVASDDNGGAT